VQAFRARNDRLNQALLPAQGKEKPIMTTLHNGDPAPDFTAPDQNGNSVSLAVFKGRKLFIFFYPKANTSG
jgi:peroxiredoxin